MRDLFGCLFDGWQGDLPVLLATAATALLVVALAGFSARRLAFRLGAIDIPGGRHIHRAPTPRLGGLAVLAGVLAAVPIGFALLANQRPEVFADARRLATILVAAIGVCLLGARDDLRPISPLTKIGGLALAGLVIVLGGVRIEFLELPFGKFELGALVGVVATIGWVLACTNAVNLIDGVDGLGAGIGLVGSLALALVAHGMGDTTSAVAFVAVAGAAGGFLLHNREPARIFLGDSGSLLLGFLLAAISANGCTKRATAVFLTAGLCALAVPLLDSTQAFVRRFRRAGAQPGRSSLLARLRATALGDREHVHHRLLDRGHTHRRVSRTVVLCALVPGLSALLLLPSGHIEWPVVAGAAAASALVLWRLLAMPSGLKRQPTSAEKGERDVVLPSSAPRRKPRPAATRQTEKV